MTKQEFENLFGYGGKYHMALEKAQFTADEQPWEPENAAKYRVCIMIGRGSFVTGTMTLYFQAEKDGEE